MKKNLTGFGLAIVLSIGIIQTYAQEVPVHDPVLIKEKSTYHLYCTGYGIASFESNDLLRWQYRGEVFTSIPAWTYEKVSGFSGHIWAPDIIYHEGVYFLYYSISSFAKNTSCIGVATNVTLNPDDPGYEWKDRGVVIQSVPNRDLWNAIDPAVAFDDQGHAWMSFGSFWQGLKLVKLDSTLLRPEQPEQWHTVSRRQRSFEIADSQPGDAAVEAPFIFKKHGYYYLFVSFDFCCRGVNSNYKIMAGRSKQITGPYFDKEGKDMALGGGSLVLKEEKQYSGAGHNSAYTFDEQDYLIFHAYDIENEGKPILRILPMEWDTDLWPIVNAEKELDCSLTKKTIN